MIVKVYKYVLTILLNKVNKHTLLYCSCNLMLRDKLDISKYWHFLFQYIILIKPFESTSFSVLFIGHWLAFNYRTFNIARRGQLTLCARTRFILDTAALSTETYSVSWHRITWGSTWLWIHVLIIEKLPSLTFTYNIALLGHGRARFETPWLLQTVRI